MVGSILRVDVVLLRPGHDGVEHVYVRTGELDVMHLPARLRLPDRAAEFVPLDSASVCQAAAQAGPVEAEAARPAGGQEGSATHQLLRRWQGLLRFVETWALTGEAAAENWDVRDGHPLKAPGGAERVRRLQ